MNEAVILIYEVHLGVQDFPSDQFQVNDLEN